MNVTTTRRGLAGRRLLVLAVLLGGGVLAGCEDDPVEPHDHAEGDVAAFRLDRIVGDSRTPIYTYDGPNNPDTLFLTDGASYEIEIVWLDEHGNELELDTDEHDWDLAENHSAIASFTRSSAEFWQGTLTTVALVPGATVYGGFSVTLFHGEEAEFQTPQIVAAVGS